MSTGSTPGGFGFCCQVRLVGEVVLGHFIGAEAMKNLGGVSEPRFAGFVAQLLALCWIAQRCDAVSDSAGSAMSCCHAGVANGGT